MTAIRHPHAPAIDAYWAGRFGCPPNLLGRPGAHLVFSEEVDPARIAVMELKDSTLIRAADEHADALSSWFRARQDEDPRTAEAVAQAFADHQWRVSPSEKVFYLDPDEFRPYQKSGVRQLTPDDSGELTSMHRGCTLEEQQAGEVNIDHPKVFGAFADGRLVAAASFIDQDLQISDVGVLVHSGFRRQGYGRAAVSALCQWGLDNGRIVQYWRLCTNTGSVRIAGALGFSEYGRYRVLQQNLTPFV